MKRILAIAFTGLLLQQANEANAQNNSSWQLIPNVVASAVGFGNGIFVISDDYAITYGNGMFVAVGGSSGLFPGGSGSTVSIRTSPNGTNWTIRVSYANTSFAGNAAFFGVIYTNNLFVAVGGDPFTPNAGIIMTSTDGVTWTQRSSGTVSGLSSVAYGNGKYVAVGNKTTDGSTLTGVELTSVNGTTWTQQNTPAPDHGIAFGKGVFVGLTDGNYIVKSTDGVSWTLTSTTDSDLNSPVADLTLYDVIFANNQFVSVGETPVGGDVFVSVDGTNWLASYKQGNGSGGFYSVTYGNGHFVAVGANELISQTANVIPDNTAPTVTITTPTNLQRMTNALANIKGTASDNIQVATVRLQLNSGSWIPATTTNVWTNWLTSLPLVSGTNTLKAYALDLSGNFSTTNSISVIASNTFILQLTFPTIKPMASNGLNFSLFVSTGLVGTIQVSSNLVNWTTFTNFSGTNTTLNFHDSAATNYARRFYRGVAQ